MSARPTSAIKSGAPGGSTSALKRSFHRKGSSMPYRDGRKPRGLPRLIEQVLQVTRWNGVRNAARLRQRRFFRAFYQHHVDDAEHIARFGVVDRAAAVAWIRSGIELQHGKRAARESPQCPWLEIGGASLGNRGRRHDRDHATVRRRKWTEHGADWEAGKKHVLSLADGIRIANAQRHKRRSCDLQECQIRSAVDGNLLAVAHLGLFLRFL